MKRIITLAGVGVLSIGVLAGCGSHSTTNAAVKNLCAKALVISSDLSANNISSLTGAKGEQDGEAFGTAALEAGPKYVSEAKVIASDLDADNVPAAQSELQMITNAC